MLDDGAGRPLLGRKLGNQLVCAVRVVDIVVGELLSLEEIGCRNAWPLLAGDVEAGALLRVFAIAHFFLENAADDAMTRHPDVESLGKPAGEDRKSGG